MSNMILAQGAEHTKPDNLVKIVNTINNEIKNHNTQSKEETGFVDQITNIIPEYSDYWKNGMINMNSYSVEEKYDGYSYINSDGKFFSKRLSQAKGNEGMPVEKTGHIPHLSNILKKVHSLCECDLHGELYMQGGISDNVTKILGCTEEEALSRQSGLIPANMLHYMLIDIRAINGHVIINMPHRVRRAILSYVYHNFIVPLDPMRYIRLTNDYSYVNPETTFSNIVKAGGEGIIIKREDAMYIPGKKPANNWIKGKKKITHDVVIMGLNSGTGKNSGLFGSIKFGHLIDGKLVSCGNCSSGLSDNMRNFVYRNADSLIESHQVFEIEAIQESVKSFRNAVFLRLRDDKDWTECKPENVRIKTKLI